MTQTPSTSGPKLAYAPKSQEFTITFAPGAVWANVSYTSHAQTIEQGGKVVPYVIYKNYEVSSTLTGFLESWEDVVCTTPTGKKCEDDYDVKASIGYPHESKQVPGVTEVDYLDSNTLTLHH